MSTRPWPVAIDRLVESAIADRPVEARTGARPDAVEALAGRPERWRIGPLVVTHLDVTHLDDETPSSPPAPRPLAAALAECASFAGPRIVGHEGDWLVTEPPAGLPADRPDLHPEPATLATLMGQGLAALHGLAPADLVDPARTASDPVAEGPVGDGPVDEPLDGWAPIVDRCRRSVEAGRVDPAALPEPYDRYPPNRLLEMLTEAVDAIRAADGGAAPVDPPVFAHGAAHPGRFVVDGDRFVGFDGFEVALVADRHLDLATTHLWVADLLGAEAVFGFYEGYGSDPHLGHLDAAVLAVRLLGTGPGRR